MKSIRPLPAVILVHALVAVNPVAAAVETAQGSFVFSFNVTNSTASDTVAIDPFSGSADQLTAVVLDFASRLFVSDNDASESSVSIGLDGDVIGIELSRLPGDQEFSFDVDLLALGFAPTLFTGGPVVFDLAAFSDEGNITGLWYAGQGVPFLALPAFGGVALNYEFDDSVSVPASGSLPLFAAGIAGLAALRRRMKCKP